MGRQEFWVGAPLLADSLSTMHYGERTRHVVAAINALGPPVEEELPLPGDAAFAARVAAHAAETGVHNSNASTKIFFTGVSP